MKVDTVLVGYDGSENAQLAMEAAMDLVADDGVVHVVTAYTPASASEERKLIKRLPKEYQVSYDALAGPSSNLRSAEKILANRGVRYESHLVENQPAAAILDTAEEVEADMIIVGSRGLGWGTRFLRGSVSTRVANHAKTSFMVVHSEE